MYTNSWTKSLLKEIKLADLDFVETIKEYLDWKNQN